MNPKRSRHLSPRSSPDAELRSPFEIRTRTSRNRHGRIASFGIMPRVRVNKRTVIAACRKNSWITSARFGSFRSGENFVATPLLKSRVAGNHKCHGCIRWHESAATESSSAPELVAQFAIRPNPGNHSKPCCRCGESDRSIPYDFHCLWKLRYVRLPVTSMHSCRGTGPNGIPNLLLFNR